MNEVPKIMGVSRQDVSMVSPPRGQGQNFLLIKLNQLILKPLQLSEFFAAELWDVWTRHRPLMPTNKKDISLALNQRKKQSQIQVSKGNEGIH